VNALPLIAGTLFLALALSAFAFSRRRVRSGPENEWTNEAYLAREAAGSWSENECAVGREDQAPPCIIPGVE
jgi:hypothetical protein